MKYQVLTASHLKSGQVIFLNDANEWTTSLHSVQVVSDEMSAARLEAVGEQAVEQNKIIGPYLIDVTIEDSKVVPVRFREQLRIFGPSTHQQFSKPVYEQVNVL